MWRDDYYTTNHLGLIKLEEILLGNFFEKDKVLVKPVFQPEDAALIKSQMAFCLRANLKLPESTKLYEQNYFERVSAISLKSETDYDQQAINCANIAQLYQFSGDGASALTWASKAENIVQEGGTLFWKLSIPCLHAYIKNLFTEKPDFSVFERTEIIQVKSEPVYKFLHSIRGYLYIELMVFDLQSDFNFCVLNGDVWQPNPMTTDLLEKRIISGLNHAIENNVPYFESMYTYQYAIFLSMVATTRATDLSSVLGLLSKSETHLNESRQYQDRGKIYAARLRVLNNYRFRNPNDWDRNLEIIFNDNVERSNVFLKDSKIAFLSILIQSEKARRSFIDLRKQPKFFHQEVDLLTDLIDRYGFKRWEAVRSSLLSGFRKSS